MDTAEPQRSLGTLAAIAAEEAEFKGLLRHSRRTSRLPWPVEFASEAEIGPWRWLLVANGPGHRLAGEACALAMRQDGLRAVLSVGLCGGLAQYLCCGDVVVATDVLDGTAPARRRHAAIPDSKLAASTGSVISVDRVAVTPAEKLDLHATGAIAVEMEALAVADCAASAGIPFYCIRAVSDTAADSLPLNFNDYRDRDGRFDRTAIARAALLRPRLAAGLLQLNQRCKQAARQLGDYLAACRF